eukprot:2331114-Amphidinium_carterae.1
MNTDLKVHVTTLARTTLKFNFFKESPLSCLKWLVLPSVTTHADSRCTPRANKQLILREAPVNIGCDNMGQACQQRCGNKTYAWIDSVGEPSTNIDKCNMNQQLPTTKI